MFYLVENMKNNTHQKENLWAERRRYIDGYPVKPFNSSCQDAQCQRDRARVIHSSSFRRLQTKTQVLSIGESDFYRTRLTHSLEVAQIGSGICEFLKEGNTSHADIQNIIPTLSQIEAICLCHDLGHPPFGHGGEVALNYFMKSCGGFEGNGQTLRIVTKLGEFSPSQGFDLTRRTLLGLLKYPSTHSKLANYLDDKNNSSSNIETSKPPKCIHDDEIDILDWILLPLNESDKSKFLSFSKFEKLHSKTIYKGFDTSIMELADDIAYGVHDLEDALALNLVTEKKWKEEILECIDRSSDLYIDKEFYNKLFLNNKERKHAISKLVYYFIRNVYIERIEFEEPLLKFQAVLASPAKKTLDILKKFVFKEVIQRPEVQALEFKGQQLIQRLFEVFSDNPNRLLPKDVLELYRSANNKQRIISDYLSGMSDTYATKLYHKLFSPSMGSIFDKM